ncbi:MAG: hypothetical protein OXD46_04205 [Chloroflexi bacterium]|nr:hypothetical protein [Chloroflexota bacterium]
MDKDSRASLWIPLILVWPLVLALHVILLPWIVAVAVVTWRSGWGMPILLCWPALFHLCCVLRGLKVEVTETNELVLIYFK